MIENIVRRAKKLSIKRQIESGEKGIDTQDLLDSIRQEFREHEDLPNTTNPDDWAKISGKKGERIVFVRTILAEGDEPHGGRQIERVRPASTSRPGRSVPTLPRSIRCRRTRSTCSRSPPSWCGSG